MTTAFAIRTFLEIIAVVLVTLTILYEDRLINFEDKIILILKRKIRRYLRRKAIEKRRANGTHIRVAETRKASPQKRQYVA